MAKKTLTKVISELLEVLEDKYGWTFTKEEKENTPIRIKNFYDEWYGKQNYNKLTAFKPEEEVDEMIGMKEIRFASLCSHHLLPFYGQVSIVYLPSEKIFGLSKLPRIVEKCASKPQTQEAMTKEIADFIENEISPRGILVVSKAIHTCMAIRGVIQNQAVTEVAVARGIIREEAKVKEEAYNLIK